MIKIINQVLFILGIMCVSVAIASEASPNIQKINCRTIHGSKECVFKISGQRSYVITNMPYALCAQAKCSLDTVNSKRAHCNCPIYGLKNTTSGWKSISLSAKKYEQVKPRYKDHALQQVTSNFSLAMAESPGHLNVAHTSCKSDSPMPWANCFGVRCSVHYVPVNGETTPMASCECPVEQSTTYISSGPKSSNECVLNKPWIWSAAEGQNGIDQFTLVDQFYKTYVSEEKS
ncbi:hypothetical protein [Legionella nagasakiensis]|uniref:hypothetical protein n=1 Tax=Legionella nagasakiensis TaxID=535290 RepID=UPI00105482D2|nr:hypothetical protein [Legionella nagasakiensis]